MRNISLHFTDYDLVKTILTKYENDFFEKREKTRFYIPIDCTALASELNTDAELIFQRLYNYLDDKYAYTKDYGAKVHLFLLELGEQKHLINYPYLTSIYANMREIKRKENSAFIISVISLVVSLMTLVFRS